MIIYYHPRYNINLGILNILHLFDGSKFKKVINAISTLKDINIATVSEPISQKIIDEFVGDLMQRLLPSKRYILQALEVPYIPFLPFSVINNRILEPMRWAVSGTLEAASIALTGKNVWNLSGGYHHASKGSAEGFCIYNDVGITVENLIKRGSISNHDRILIIDIDAHHGNGNAYVFMDNSNVTMLDIYNNDIYPMGDYTKERINVNIPLNAKTCGDEYLSKLKAGLDEIQANYKLAFVIAGTDVLYTDPLGGLGLTVDECVCRDQLVFEKIQSLSIPSVFLGGGGYGNDSAITIIKSITNLYQK
jgi:histone deacetylase 11